MTEWIFYFGAQKENFLKGYYVTCLQRKWWYHSSDETLNKQWVNGKHLWSFKTKWIASLYLVSNSNSTIVLRSLFISRKCIYLVQNFLVYCDFQFKFEAFTGFFFPLTPIKTCRMYQYKSFSYGTISLKTQA